MQMSALGKSSAETSQLSEEWKGLNSVARVIALRKEGVTMRMVAKRFGVIPKTIYNAFDAVEALAAEIPAVRRGE